MADTQWARARAATLSVVGLPAFAGATLTVRNSTVAHNHAQGGKAEFGGSGGNGFGGGFYEDAGRPFPPVPATSRLALEGSLVSFNLALGGEAADGGSNGQGVGGGIYALGLFTFDEATKIQKNQASTGDKNIAP